MLRYTLRRLVMTFFVILVVSLVSFMLIRVSGDPAIALAGEGATQQEIEYVRHHYGFDRPLIIQYVDWAKRALRGDLGESPYFNEPVLKMIKDRIGVTMTLGISALLFALIVSIPMGVLASIRPNTWIDRVALTISVMGQAMPSFWFGLIMIIFFGVTLRWLPISGSGSPAHYVMPTIALGYYATPAFMRLIRSGMLEVLASDHIRTARAKGLRWGKILFKHALRNAIIPVVTTVGLQVGALFSGALLVEFVFGWPGIGRLAVNSIFRRDSPMLLGIMIFGSAMTIVANLLTDLAYRLIDPRIRVGGSR